MEDVGIPIYPYLSFPEDKMFDDLYEAYHVDDDLEKGLGRCSNVQEGIGEVKLVS